MLLPGVNSWINNSVSVRHEESQIANDIRQSFLICHTKGIWKLLHWSADSRKCQGSCYETVEPYPVAYLYHRNLYLCRIQQIVRPPVSPLTVAWLWYLKRSGHFLNLHADCYLETLLHHSSASTSFRPIQRHMPWTFLKQQSLQIIHCMLMMC